MVEVAFVAYIVPGMGGGFIVLFCMVELRARCGFATCELQFVVDFNVPGLKLFLLQVEPVCEACGSFDHGSLKLRGCLHVPTITGDLRCASAREVPPWCGTICVTNAKLL